MPTCTSCSKSTCIGAAGVLHMTGGVLDFKLKIQPQASQHPEERRALALQQAPITRRLRRTTACMSTC